MTLPQNLSPSLSGADAATEEFARRVRPLLGQRPLFVSDLDGTLLGPDSRVSPTSVALINGAIEHGALFTAATARTPATVDPLLRQLHLSADLVVMTGAALWDPRSRRIDGARFIPDDVSAEIVGCCRSAGLEPFVYTLPDPAQGDAAAAIEAWHMRQLADRERRFMEERTGLELKRFILTDDPAQLCRRRTALIFAVDLIERIEECGDALRRAGRCTVSAYRDIFNHRLGFLEVFAPGVSKAAAVAEVAERCGATSTVVFGDNLNDIAMMRSATVAVAVGNAFDEVKQAAHYVIGPNTADSVAHAVALLTGSV